MLTTEHRLYAQAVAYVVRRGKGLSGPFLRIRWVAGKGRTPRVAVVTPLAVDKRATRRNLVKRRLREALRPLFSSFISSTQLVVFAQKGAAERTFQELQGELVSLLKKAGIL